MSSFFSDGRELSCGSRKFGCVTGLGCRQDSDALLLVTGYRLLTTLAAAEGRAKSWCLRGEKSGLLVTGYRLLATLAAAEGRTKYWCLCG